MRVTGVVALAFSALVLAGILWKNEGEKFESIEIGDKEEWVYELLGDPSEINQFGEFKDLRYWISYSEGGYSLLSVSLGLPRIIRIKDGIVASKGMNEAYYDPFKPGWVPIQPSSDQP